MTKYDELSIAVQNAGFFSTSTEEMGSWDRIVVANKRLEHGLAGNSFWIALIHGKWYLGTWGGAYYYVNSFALLRGFVLDNLTENYTTAIEFDPLVCSRFQISPIELDEFNKVVGHSAP